MTYNITNNLENFHYNVVVANIHEIYNACDKYENDENISNKILRDYLEKIMILIMPLIPHIASECLEKINNKINFQSLKWPTFETELLKQNEFTLVIQINGRKRGSLVMPVDLGESSVEKQAKTVDNVKKYLDNKKIKRQIYLKNKLINFII